MRFPVRPDENAGDVNTYRQREQFRRRLQVVLEVKMPMVHTLAEDARDANEIRGRRDVWLRAALDLGCQIRLKDNKTDLAGRIGRWQVSRGKRALRSAKALPDILSLRFFALREPSFGVAWSRSVSMCQRISCWRLREKKP